MLPIDPPKTGETIDEFSARVQQCDPLFQYICQEDCTVADAREYVTVLDCVINDLLSVRDAVWKMPTARIRKRQANRSSAK